MGNFRRGIKTEVRAFAVLVDFSLVTGGRSILEFDGRFRQVLGDGDQLMVMQGRLLRLVVTEARAW